MLYSLIQKILLWISFNAIYLWWRQNRFDLRKSGIDFAAEQTNAKACERKRTRDSSNEDIHNVWTITSTQAFGEDVRKQGLRKSWIE